MLFITRQTRTGKKGNPERKDRKSSSPTVYVYSRKLLTLRRSRSSERSALRKKNECGSEVGLKRNIWAARLAMETLIEQQKTRGKVRKRRAEKK